MNLMLVRNLSHRVYLFSLEQPLIIKRLRPDRSHVEIDRHSTINLAKLQRLSCYVWISIINKR